MRSRSEVTVGLVVLLGLLLIFFGTVWLKGGPFGAEEQTIHARFREVGQILEGNSVKLRGVPIGRVERIFLDPEGNAVLVAMRVSREVRLPEDPVVLLSPESLFGDWQAEILPRSQFPIFDYAESPDPEVLPGYSLPDISRLTAVADRIAENLAVLTERVEIAFTEETAMNIRRAIENITALSDQFTATFQRQQRTLDDLAQDLRTTTETLSQTAETIQRTFARMEDAVDEGQLQAIVANVQQATARVDSLSLVLLDASEQLRTTAANADSAFQSVATITAGLEQGEGTLGQLLRDPELYTEIRRTNAEIQALLQDIQANPRKYINLSVF